MESCGISTLRKLGLEKIATKMNLEKEGIMKMNAFGQCEHLSLNIFLYYVTLRKFCLENFPLE